MSKIQLDKAALSSEIAVRSAVTNYVQYFSQLSDPDPVLSKLGKSVSVYKDLSADAHVFANIQQRKAGVTSMQWQINQNDSDSAVFDFIRNLFKRWDIDIITDQILNAPLYGYAALEVVWMYDDSKLVPLKIEEKPREWFKFDNLNRLMLVTDKSPTGMLIPDYKILLVQNNPTYENPYGDKVLSRVFWPVTFKRGGMKFWVTFTEKYGMPYIFGKQPRGGGEEAAADLLDKLENMVQDAVAVIPDDSSIEIMELKSGAAVDAYRLLLEFLNSEISKAILTQTLTTEIQGRGSYAASETHSGMLNTVLLSDKKLVEKTFNKLISWIITLNFPNTNNHPIFELYNEAVVSTTQAQRDETLSKIGVEFTGDYFKKNYNLSDDDFSLRSGKFSQSLRFASPTPSPRLYSPEKIVEALSPQLLQFQIEQPLSAVFTAIESAQSYQDALDSLASIYPLMKTGQIENLLERVLLVSSMLGAADADK